MKFYIGTQKIEHNEKSLFLTTRINDSELEDIKPLLDCISGLEIWKDKEIVELTSKLECNTGLLPMDTIFLTNFCDYVECHNGVVETMEIGILDYRLILAKFDSYDSLFVERQQLNSFIKDLSTNSKGRYRARKVA